MEPGIEVAAAALNPTSAGVRMVSGVGLFVGLLLNLVPRVFSLLSRSRESTLGTRLLIAQYP